MKSSLGKKRITRAAILVLGMILLITSISFAEEEAAYEIKGNAERIPVFVYHRFCANEEYSKIKEARSLTITEEKLEEQMKFLQDNGYKTISMEEFEDWYDGNIELPRKTVMITIDDGKYSAVKYALPIFEKYKIKSTMFVIGNRTEETTNKTEGEENLHSVGFDVIEDLEENHPDFAVQSHTYSMHKWDENDSPKIYNYTEKMCEEDLALQNDIFGFEYLAYPFGAYTDEMIAAIVSQGDIRMAFTYGNNRYATRDQGRYEIERIKVSGQKDLESFASWLDEGYPMVKALTTDFISNENLDAVNNSFTFESNLGDEYVIMRKNLFKWEEVDTVIGEDQETTWVDKEANSSSRYRYSVSRILEKDEKGNVVAATPYDEKGLKTLNKTVYPKVGYTNLRSRITFVRRIGVSGYKIYRKYGDKDYEFLIDKKQRKWPIISYSDVYKKSCHKGEIHSRITFKNFIDPSNNDLVYTARAFIQNKDRGTLIQGPMLLDGDFRIADPTIVDVWKTSPDTAEVKFATVPNATAYTVFSGKKYDEEVKWEVRARVEKISAESTMEIEINNAKGDDYFTVQAEFKKNGKRFFSGMEQNYTTRYRKEAKGKKILVIGASGSYGCPYKRKDIRFIFSYPYRMGNMIGAEVTNVSVPGATYSTIEGNRAHILSDVVDKIENGETIDRDCYTFDVLNRNLEERSLEDFDIVLVVAGGNDYNSDFKPGDVESTDTTTFAGGINYVIDKLCEASNTRKEEGKNPTAIIMVGTTYSDRRAVFAELNNRYETPNTAGYTLQDFQDVFEEIYHKYEEKGENIYLVGSEEFLNQGNCPTATTDNLHMTRITNGEFGAYLAKMFVELDMLGQE